MEINNKILKLKDEIFQKLKSNKEDFVKRYGKDAEKVMYGIAMKQAEEEVSPDDRLEEVIQRCLSKPTKKLMEKMDLEDDEWKDPYKEYDKDLTDYEPSQKEIEAFERDRDNIQPKQKYTPIQKAEYTGWAYLEVKVGLGKWQTVKYGPNKLIYGEFNKLLKQNPLNSNNYRVIPERKK